MIWLEASTAVDRKDTKRAQAAFKRIVQQDPDIDSVRQAGIESDKIVLGMRQERRELGLGRANRHARNRRDLRNSADYSSTLGIYRRTAHSGTRTLNG